MVERLRIVVDARLPGQTGGVQQVVLGLASGLAQIAGPREEYMFLAWEDSDEWLRPYVHGACRIVYARSRAKPRLRSFLKRIPGVTRLHRELQARRAPAPVSLPVSDGTVEALQPDAIHFPHPAAFITEVPSIYLPWDLQHVHYPDFFTTEQRLYRDLAYPTFIRQAAIVSVATEWGKRDLVTNLGVPAEKIEVIPVAPVLTVYAAPSARDLEATRRKFDLPQRFVYLPAHTWPHKNHQAVIEALGRLRRNGRVVHVVFSGGITSYAEEVRSRAASLGVLDQVHFVGYVSPLEVQCLYRTATCLVFPSRFEGWGLPVTEAYLAGLPVACSTAACLPEVASGAALMFDPDDYDRLAMSIARLFDDDALRSDLIARGHAVARRLSWEETARRFRDLYLRLAARPHGR